MDAIMRRVLEKLKKRQTHVELITYKDDQSMKPDLFLQAQTIRVEQLNLLGLKQLSQLSANSQWVTWLIEGLSYDVTFQLQLATDATALIPFELLTNWPLSIYDKRGNAIRGFSTRAITYGQVVVLTEGTKLIVRKDQQITALAKDLMIKKNIKCLERTDSSCKWQK